MRINLRKETDVKEKERRGKLTTPPAVTATCDVYLRRHRDPSSKDLHTLKLALRKAARNHPIYTLIIHTPHGVCGSGENDFAKPKLLEKV